MQARVYTGSWAPSARLQPWGGGDRKRRAGQEMKELWALDFREARGARLVEFHLEDAVRLHAPSCPLP